MTPHRSKGVGKLLGEAYLDYAPKLVGLILAYRSAFR
jgi:hypothetical protein